MAWCMRDCLTNMPASNLPWPQLETHIARLESLMEGQGLKPQVMGGGECEGLGGPWSEAHGQGWTGFEGVGGIKGKEGPRKGLRCVEVENS